MSSVAQLPPNIPVWGVAWCSAMDRGELWEQARAGSGSAPAAALVLVVASVKLSSTEVPR